MANQFTHACNADTSPCARRSKCGLALLHGCVSLFLTFQSERMLMLLHVPGRHGIHRTSLLFITTRREHSSQRVKQISVNASIIADSGGPCVCNDPVDPACMSNVEYDLCLNEVRQELIISTAAISALASFLMGFFANLPIGMAPGLGINAYVSRSITFSLRPALYGVMLPTVVFHRVSPHLPPTMPHKVHVHLTDFSGVIVRIFDRGLSWNWQSKLC